MPKIKCASFFAGVGGIDIGFEGFADNKSNTFEIVYANEYDSYPIKTYELNSSIKVDHRDIHLVEPKDIPDVSLIAGGFPCTSFSIAGYRKGFEDEKTGDLFFELARIIKAKKPRAIFLENVKNLKSHDNGKTFQIIEDCLSSIGYYTKHIVMNASEYGNIPQNRERIYIVGFRNKKDIEKFSFPNVIPLTTKLSDIIDFNHKVDEKYYYTEGKFKDGMYDILKEKITNKDTVYQWRRQYVRENKSGCVPCLTANMGTGGHNVPLVKTKYGIRKLTPYECFRTQGFPKDFKLPKDVVDSRLYKQAGNSVCVTVISRIAKEIEKVISK